MPKEISLNYQVLYQRYRRLHYAEGDPALRTGRVSIALPRDVRFFNRPVVLERNNNHVPTEEVAVEVVRFRSV